MNALNSEEPLHLTYVENSHPYICFWILGS